MKLSEHMMFGAMLRPQAFGVLFDGVGTCANGAVLESLGWKPRVYDTSGWLNMPKDLLTVLDIQVRNPVTKQWANLCSVIIDLNNNARWSRQEIAAFVASAEAQHPELCEPQEELAVPSVPIYEETQEEVVA